MMPLVVDAFAALLSAGPQPVLPAGRVGSRRPAGSSDLPAAVISLTVDAAKERWPRDPDRDRYAGLLAIEVWAATAADADMVARALQRRVHDSRAALRQHGFTHCAPAALEILEDVRHQPAVGSAFTAHRQRIAYRFAFESTLVALETEGGPITQIDVGVGAPAGEQMRIT